MKCFLLYLALELVTSDKLDRTYLPPPGAKLSGGRLDDLQTPLEYPKETYHEPTHNNQFHGNQGQHNEIANFAYPIDSTPKSPSDFSQAMLFPKREYYDSTIPTLTHDVDYYGRLSTKLPNDYLPSHDTSAFQQSAFNSGPGLKSNYTMKNLMQYVNNEQEPGYYYYVPRAQTYRNNVANNEPNIVGSSDVRDGSFSPFGNQVDNKYTDAKLLTPKSRPAEKIPQTNEHSAFGIYGGNPMIMTSQKNFAQKIRNMVLTPMYGDFQNNLTAMPVNLNEQSVVGTLVAHPFLTPLVGTNAQSAHKISNVTGTVDSPISTKQAQFGKTTISSLITKNEPQLESRKSTFAESKFMYQSSQQGLDKNSVILNYDNVITPEGYSYSFDTSNGIRADESGTAIGGVKATGSYSYTGDDGKVYSVSYTADENGFQPRGDHLPTPPPIPEAIKKVIEQAAIDKVAGIIDDGSYDERKYGHKNYQGAVESYHPFKKDGNVNISLRRGSTIFKPNGVQRKAISNTGNLNNNQTSEALTFNNDLPNPNNMQAADIRLINRRPNNHIRAHGDSSSSDKPLSKENIKESNTGRDQNNFLRLRPVNVTNKIQQQVFSDNVNINNLQPMNKNRIQIESKLENNDIIDNYIQIKNQNGVPSFLDTGYNQNNYTSSSTIDNINTDTDISKYNNQGQPNYVLQSQPDSKKVQYSQNKITSYDTGYYYVPPVIKFEEEPLNKNPDPISYKNIAFVTTDKPVQEDINANVSRRTSLDSTQNQEEYENSVNKDSTRKPYISGPKDQVRGNYYDDTTSQFLNPSENYENRLATYPNELDSPYYVFTTTPMLPQTTHHEYQPTVGYPILHYQAPVNSEGIKGILHNSPENKDNAAGKRPEISVTQDFVTSTYKPGIDGINLKVNQNVNIYGFGRPTPTDTTKDFPNKVSTYYDGLYTTSTPKEEFKFTGYPDTSETKYQSTNYDNGYITTNTPFFEDGLEFTGTYNNPEDGGSLPIGTTEVPKSLNFTSNNFENSELRPDEDIIIPNFNNNAQYTTDKVIGEDFSGPKQPQSFDTETGYHYK